MKRYLSSTVLAAVLILGGCKQATPEPDFSGIQDIPYTMEQFTGIPGPAHVSIYPNPFFDQLTISVHNPSNHEATIYISDEKGKYSKKITVTPDAVSNHVRLDFGSMPKGVYLCEVQHPGKVDRYRLIKAR